MGGRGANSNTTSFEEVYKDYEKGGSAELDRFLGKDNYVIPNDHERKLAKEGKLTPKVIYNSVIDNDNIILKTEDLQDIKDFYGSTKALVMPISRENSDGGQAVVYVNSFARGSGDTVYIKLNRQRFKTYNFKKSYEGDNYYNRPKKQYTFDDLLKIAKKQTQGKQIPTTMKMVTW